MAVQSTRFEDQAGEIVQARFGRFLKECVLRRHALDTGRGLSTPPRRNGAPPLM